MRAIHTILNWRSRLACSHGGFGHCGDETGADNAAATLATRDAMAEVDRSSATDTAHHSAPPTISGPLAGASDHSARHEKGAHGMGAATTPRRGAVVVVAGAGRGIGRATALKLPERWRLC